jgi:UDP-glucose 4-epimerase
MPETKNPRNPKNTLITGGCGFIGANLVNHLLKKGIRYIRVLDNECTGTKKNLEDALEENGKIISRTDGDNITYKCKMILNEDIQHTVTIDLMMGDIRSHETCLEATQTIDWVVHLAAHPGVIPSIEDPFYDCEVNVKGTLNLLYASVKRGVNKFIFASSNALLGSQDPPVHEEYVPRPLSPYGSSKLAGEGYCSAFHASYGLKTVCLRFSNVYGPYSLHKNSVIAKFLRDALLRGELTIYGDGHQTRDFIHVDDISQAIHLLLEMDLTSHEVWGTPLNLGTGKETSILELAALIQGFFHKKVKISFAPERKGEIKRNYSDITKARKILGFLPQIPLGDGLESVYTWLANKDHEEITEAAVLAGSE